MKLAGALRAAEPDADALDDFGEEGKPLMTVRPSRRALSIAVTAIALGVVGGGAAFAVSRGMIPFPGRMGTITMESTPAGAEVFVAGVSKGHTPLSFRAPAGEYAVEVVSGGQRVPLQVRAAAGAVVSDHVRFADTPRPPTVELAALVVTTQPAHLQVRVDDVERGPSPVRLAGLLAGKHRIHVGTPGGSLDREVDLKNGESLSLVITVGVQPPPAPSDGWITVVSAIPLRMMEGGRVVGTSDAGRIMVSAGAHDLQFVNDDLAFHESRRVMVAGGKTATVRVDPPTGRISINAVPWADVWVDADHIGETPIGNLAIPIGSHQIVFRHPEFGERRERVTVGTHDVARAAIDFTKR